MSRLYFLWAEPEKDQAHLEITKKELGIILNWFDFKQSEIGTIYEEKDLAKKIEEMKKEADQH